MKNFITIPLHNLRMERVERLARFIETGLLNADFNCFLAGGALRTILTGEYPADYDVFFRSGETVDKVRAWLAHSCGFECIFECPENLLFTYERKVETFSGPQTEMKIQLILKDFQDPIATINSFDFHAAMAAIDYNNLYFHKNWIKDVRSKVLSMHRVTFPVATMKRLDKYRNKGYNTYQAMVEFVQMVAASGGFDPESMELYID